MFIAEGIFKTCVNITLCSINCTMGILGFVIQVQNSLADTFLKMYSTTVPLVSLFLMYVINHEKIDAWFKKTFKKKPHDQP